MIWTECGVAARQTIQALRVGMMVDGVIEDHRCSSHRPSSDHSWLIKLEYSFQTVFSSNPRNGNIGQVGHSSWTGSLYKFELSHWWMDVSACVCFFSFSACAPKCINNSAYQTGLSQTHPSARGLGKLKRDLNDYNFQVSFLWRWCTVLTRQTRLAFQITYKHCWFNGGVERFSRRFQEQVCAPRNTRTYTPNQQHNSQHIIPQAKGTWTKV